MSDFNNPIPGQGYLALLASITENNQSALKLLDGVTPLTNLPTNAKQWNRTNSRFENWNGSTWAELAALFEMKVRNSDQLNGQAASYYQNAGNLNAGTLLGARFNDSSHGNRAGGTLHANASGSAAGFMSAADYNKLAAIESGATADQSAAEILSLLLSLDGAGSGLDADVVDGYHASSLLARSNHTGTQPSSTITGLGSLAALSSVPPAYLAADVGAWVELSSVALSGAPCAFTSLLTSTYDNYIIIINNMHVINDPQNVTVRVGFSGVYSSSNIYELSDAGSAGDSFLVADSMANDSTHVINGTIRIFEPSNTSRFKQIIFDISYWYGSSLFKVNRSAGVVRSTSAIDSIEILASGNHFNGGTARLYGLKT